MGFDNDNFLDDYEIQELINRFEDQLENDRLSFFDADEINIMIDYYIQKEDFKRINVLSQLAERFHSSSPLFNTIMAKKYLSVQDAENAIKFLNEDDTNSQDPDFYVNLGYCQSLLNNHKESIYAYKKAIKLLDKEEFEDIYSSIGVEYMLLRDYEKALLYLKKGLKACPDITEQYIEIADCYFSLDKGEEAVVFFQSEVDKSPFNINAWMILGNCYLRLHLLEKAVEQYEYVLAIDQHHGTAYTHIATILNELDKYQDTIEIIEEAFRNKVEVPVLYCLYAEALAKTGNKLDAVTNFKKAIEMDENTAEAYAGLAFIFCEEDNPKSAIKFLKHAIALAPFNTDYMFVMVEQHNKLGKYKESLKYLKEIEEIAPYELTLYIALMEVYIMLDDIKKAIKSIEKGLKVLGREPALLYRMSFINFVYENYEAGITYLEEALSLDFEGVHEFIDFDPNFILNDENIVNLINEYRIKNNK